MIKAEIVADSLSPQGDRLVSVLCTFPRIILAEVNTHRMLSGNTSSSRAIPFFKAVESVINDTFIPIAWQTHHKGMQGSEYISADTIISSDMFFYDFIKLIEVQAEEDKVKLTKDFYDVINSLKVTFNSIFVSGSYTIAEFWVKTRDLCIFSATMLYTVGKVSKQICNRLLEPFMWTVKLITGSLEQGWDNFFNLRCPDYHYQTHTGSWITKIKSKVDFMRVLNQVNPLDKEIDRRLFKNQNLWFELNKGAAEIHMMQLAECIWDAFNESTPRRLKAGDWHIPFHKQLRSVHFNAMRAVNDEELDLIEVKASTALAARTSYTVVGEEKVLDGEQLIGLHDRLVAQQPPHSSPMEHCAKCMNDDEYYYNVKGVLNHETNHEPPYPKNNIQGWCRNFRGFIPYRHIIETQSKN